MFDACVLLLREQPQPTAAVDLTLSGQELAEIDAVVPRDLVVGSRYQETMMSLLDG